MGLELSNFLHRVSSKHMDHAFLVTDPDFSRGSCLDKCARSQVLAQVDSLLDLEGLSVNLIDLLTL